MLTLMRQLLRSKIFGGIVFGLVIISMAVWGTGDVFSGGLGDHVIKAGERGVDQVTLNRRFETYLRRARLETGTNITQQKALEDGTLDQIINIEAQRLSFLGYGRALGADASDAALIKFIQESDEFVDPTTGKFSQQVYDAILQQEFNRVRRPKQTFEAERRDQLTFNYIADAIGAAVSTPAALARVEAAIYAENRRASWFTLRSEFLPEAPPPTDEAARAFFDTNIEDYRIDERRSLAIVEISPEIYANDVPVDEAEVLEVYEIEKTSRFAEPQQRVISEAIFSNEDDAQAAYGQLAGGGDISNAPGLISFDARQITQTQFDDPEIAQTIFNPRSLTSSIFGPYPIAGNWVLIRLDEIIDGAPIPLNDEIREEIRREIALDGAQDLFNDAYVEIDNLLGLRLTPDEFAERLGVPVKRYEPIDRVGRKQNGEPILELAPFAEGIGQAFNELFEGDTGDRFDTPEGAYLVILESVVPSTLASFEDAKDQVIARMISERVSSGFDETAAAIEARLNGGESTFDSEAASFNSTVVRPAEGLTRRTTDSGLSRDALQSIFSGNEGDFIVAAGNAPDERIIIRIEAITPAAPEELDLLAPQSAGSLTISLGEDLDEAHFRAVINDYPAIQDVRAINAYKSRIAAGQ